MIDKKKIYKRLYNDYSKKYLDKIFLSGFFSIVVAGSTSAIAWLLDPAIKKLFIEKDQSLILIIPLLIIFAFASKGFSLYLAKKTMIAVGESIKKKLQSDMLNNLIQTDFDHRIAMAFCIMGTRLGPLNIKDSDSINTSFPSFKNEFNNLGGNIF